METTTEIYHKGRGAQINTHNRFLSQQYVQEYGEVLDEEFVQQEKTEIIYTYPKTIINKVESADLPFEYSMNPYQGCEHGCIYCYARPTHEYWGYSAGLDFERKILVKKNVVELLEKHFSSRKWEPAPIMLSGNTDCYQPVEKQMELTRKILQVCLKYRHPVSIITKNSLVRRDLDILKQLAAHNLVYVTISITGVDEKIKQVLEPRTASYRSRIETIRLLAAAGIPCGVNVAPVVPGINNHQILEILEKSGEAGAWGASMTIVRLNGAIGKIFKDWLFKNHPDRAEKVWNQVSACHGGNVNDSRFGVRMRGEGKIAESINQLFRLSRSRFINKREFEFNCNDFNCRANDAQLTLF